jgi:hypothetical protein
MIEMPEPEKCGPPCEAAGRWGATGRMPAGHTWFQTEHGGYLAHMPRPARRVRVEWLVGGSWEPYTAWYAPDQREHLEDTVEANKRAGSVQTFRVAEEKL